MPKRGTGSNSTGRRALLVAGSSVIGAAVGAVAMGEADAYEAKNRPPTYHVSPPPPPGVKSFAGQVIWRFDADGLALTFDDGPDPKWTPQILDLLGERSKATFFVLRWQVKKHPALLRRMHAAGHEIGLHGLNHADMTTLSSSKVRSDMEATSAAIADVTGVKPVVMRPPYGRFDAPVLHAATALGMPLVLWSDRFPGDDSRAAAKQLLAHQRPGAIILSHDGRGSPTQEMVDALRDYVKDSVAHGQTFRTVSSMLANGTGS